MIRVPRCISAFVFISLLFTSSAYAQCDPVISGAIINVAAECFNESTALVVNPGSADQHGWQYSDDTGQDSVNGGTVGGTAFEIFGTAFSERYVPSAGDEINRYQLCLVLNSNLPLNGVAYGAAADGNIGWGDVLINLGTGDFLSTSQGSELFAVRFAGENDSGAADVGTYKDVSGMSVSGSNSGFAHWNAYANHVTNKGKSPVMGDLGSDPTGYYSGSISENVIDLGTLITQGVTFLTDQQLEDLGFDIDRWPGENIGFCWNKWDWIDPCGVIGGDGSLCRHCGELCGPGGDDSDNDGTKDCADDCDDDPAKTEPGQCGCGVADTDNDNDGTANCNDECVEDSAKTAAGLCGCGVADTDSDSDGTPDCNDDCESDPLKTTTGQCGCGVADTDSDQDGTANCNDGCVEDPEKTDAGICGCGVSDIDSDQDGTADCNDECIDDANKTSAGICGCGVADTDSDGDNVADCNDSCIDDADKVDPGICGCGVSDIDSDLDGIADCNDLCPEDSEKSEAGSCGCGVADVDSDEDGVLDCQDLCPNDADKTVPGQCGCGFTEHFCQDDSFAVCGDGLLHKSEQCDDGNSEIGDGCVNCQFEDDLILNSDCDVENTSELQAQLDGYAKSLEKKGRKYARKVTRLAKARGVSTIRWQKNIFEDLNRNQISAWTAIWVPSSIKITCNDAGTQFCSVVSNTESLQTYQIGIDNLLRLSRKIRRRLKREAVLAGDTRVLRKAKRYQRKYRKMQQLIISDLAQMPTTNLACADVVLP